MVTWYSINSNVLGGMALFAGAVLDHLDSSFRQDNGLESGLSDNSNPSSLSDKDSVEPTDEEPSVAYLTPTHRSKSANYHNERQTKPDVTARKKGSRKTDDEEPPGLPLSSESERFADQLQRKGESVPGSTRRYTDGDDEAFTHNGLIVTSAGRIQSGKEGNGSVFCSSRKSSLSDDVEYAPQRKRGKNKGCARTSPRKTVCSLFDFEAVTSKAHDQLADANGQNPVLEVLKDISSTLNNPVDRVQSTEKEIKSVKKKLRSGSVSSSDSSSTKKEITIPNIIRVSVHVYL